MPVTGGTLRVEGLAELQRAFYILDRDLAGDLRDGLRRAAEPVKVHAEALTRARINNGRVPWWQMRTGVTRQWVYVAPKQRGRKGRDQRYRRPNFASMVTPLMVQSLNQNEAAVMASVGRVLDRSIEKWGRG